MKVDKNVKQTFRLLEKVVRETKLRASSLFSESGDVILSYQKEQLIMTEKDSAFPYIRHCVDVRD